jgi:hypothetical protein
LSSFLTFSLHYDDNFARPVQEPKYVGVSFSRKKGGFYLAIIQLYPFLECIQVIPMKDSHCYFAHLNVEKQCCILQNGDADHLIHLSNPNEMILVSDDGHLGNFKLISSDNECVTYAAYNNYGGYPVQIDINLKEKHCKTTDLPRDFPLQVSTSWRAIWIPPEMKLVYKERNYLLLNQTGETVIKTNCQLSNIQFITYYEDDATPILFCHKSDNGKELHFYSKEKFLYCIHHAEIYDVIGVIFPFAFLSTYTSDLIIYHIEWQQVVFTMKDFHSFGNNVFLLPSGELTLQSRNGFYKLKFK